MLCLFYTGENWNQRGKELVPVRQLIHAGGLAPEFTILTDNILHSLSKGQQPQV